MNGGLEQLAGNVLLGQTESVAGGGFVRPASPWLRLPVPRDCF